MLTYSFATPSHVKQKSEARRSTIYSRQETTHDVYCSCSARNTLSRDVTRYARRIRSTEWLEEFEQSFMFDWRDSWSRITFLPSLIKCRSWDSLSDKCLCPGLSLSAGQFLRAHKGLSVPLSSFYLAKPTLVMNKAITRHVCVRFRGQYPGGSVRGVNEGR